MKIAISVLLSILMASSLHAERFTILAQSGLNIRKEPNSKSAKVGSIPFGTVVNTELSYETDIDYSGRYKHFTEVIEGKQGFWMKISHGKLEGYIFSGFGLIGEWVVKSTDINKDFRLLQTGPYCDAINYDPKLNWYGLWINRSGRSPMRSVVIVSHKK